MKRRDFLTAGTAGLAALTTTATLSAQPDPIGRGQPRQQASTRPFTEVRQYTVKDANKRAQLVELLDKALIPALNRQGIRPVGVFVPIERAEKYALNLFVVIPHRTAASFVNTNTRLVDDAEYRDRKSVV